MKSTIKRGQVCGYARANLQLNESRFSEAKGKTCFHYAERE